MNSPPRLSHSPSQVYVECTKFYMALNRLLRHSLTSFLQSSMIWGYVLVIMILFFFLRSSSLDSIVLLLYVDNMILTGEDIVGIQLLKNQLLTYFEMKDLG